MAGPTRGFVGRRRNAEDGRLPPGQYDVGSGWPVLTAEATPRLVPERWTMTLDGLVANPTTWTWAEMHALPQTRYEGDIHCVTTWSKLGTNFTGVSVDELLDRAQPLATATHVLATSTTGYTTNLPLEELQYGQGLDRLGARGKAADTGARRAGAAARTGAVLLEVGEVGHPADVARPRPARVLGAERLPRPRRPLERGALLR